MEAERVNTFTKINISDFELYSNRRRGEFKCSCSRWFLHAQRKHNVNSQRFICVLRGNGNPIKMNPFESIRNNQYRISGVVMGIIVACGQHSAAHRQFKREKHGWNRKQRWLIHILCSDLIQPDYQRIDIDCHLYSRRQSSNTFSTQIAFYSFKCFNSAISVCRTCKSLMTSNPCERALIPFSISHRRCPRIRVYQTENAFDPFPRCNASEIPDAGIRHHFSGHTRVFGVTGAARHQLSYSESETLRLTNFDIASTYRTLF